MRSTLASMSPCSSVEGVILAAFKSYFDGSGSGGFAVLACVAGDETVWSQLEAEWERVRKERGNPPYVHMTDAMSLENDFLNWKDEDRDFLVDGLLNVLLRFKDNPRLHSFVCTVDLTAYKAIRKSRTLPAPARICARLVMPFMWDWYGALPDPILGPMELSFDRNEPFMHHIRQDWISPRIRKRHPSWGMIRSIGEAAMELTPALQVADMVAWGRHRLVSYGHHEKPWEVDQHYATAVMAAGGIRWGWIPIGKEELEKKNWKEEGYEAINPQKWKLEASRIEAANLERMIQNGLRSGKYDIGKG